MKRLTQKILYDGEEYYGSIDVPCDDSDYLELVYNKLGTLEDIEEELGIDVETLLKVLKNRHIYVLNSYHTEFRGEHGIQDYIEIENIYYVEFSQEELEWVFTFHVYEDYASYPCLVKLKDFGKTWAFNKDDLSEE